MTKLTISVNDDEFVRLVQMANQELRDPRDQARYILRSVLLGATVPTNNKSDVNIRQDSHVAFAESTL